MSYYIKLRDKAFGPFNQDKLSQMVSTGKVSIETEVSTDKRYWQPLYQFPELVATIPGLQQQAQYNETRVTNNVEQVPSQPQENYSPPQKRKSFFSSLSELFSINNNAPKAPSYTSNQYATPASGRQSGGGKGMAAAIVMLFFLVAILFGIVIFQVIQINKLSKTTIAAASTPKPGKDNTAEDAPKHVVSTTVHSNISVAKRLAREAPKSVVRIQVDGGHGSGVVIAHDGNYALILTNRHVISEKVKDEDDDVRTVYFNKVGVVILDAKDGEVHDGQVKPASLVAIPTLDNIDLALVLVGDKDNKLVPQWKIASMDDLEQGDDVYAIGHPGDFPFTITSGICSAKRNELSHREVQHTASINPGNSGGPLLNNNGEIIGINTYERVRSGGIPEEIQAKIFGVILNKFNKKDSRETLEAIVLLFNLLFEENKKEYNSLFFSMPADYVFDDSQWTFREKEDQTKKLLEKVQRAPKKSK